MNRHGFSRGTDCAAILLLFANRKRKVTSIAVVNNEQSDTVTTALNRITVTLRNMIGASVVKQHHRQQVPTGN